MEQTVHIPVVHPLINSENAPTEADYRRFRNQQIAKGVIAGGLRVASGVLTSLSSGTMV